MRSIQVPPLVADTAQFVFDAVHTYRKHSHGRARRYWDEDLCGACMIASFALVRALSWRGVKNARLAFNGSGDTHCWVELPQRRLVVDVTAEQFNGKRQVHYDRVGNWIYVAEIRGDAVLRHLSVADEIRIHNAWVSRLLRRLRTVDCVAVLERAAS